MERQSRSCVRRANTPSSVILHHTSENGMTLGDEAFVKATNCAMRNNPESENWWIGRRR